MRKSLFTLLSVIFLFSVGFAQKSTVIKLKSANNNFVVSSVKNTGFTVSSSMSELSLKPVSFKQGEFMSLENSNLIKIYDVGMPNIPVMSKLIEVPQGATVELIVKSYDEEIIKLSEYGITNKIQPALRSQSKSEDEVPFVLNKKVYNTNDFINKKIAIYEDAGQLRATRLGRIQISPIQYNPVKNTLRILNNLIVEVKFNNADYAKTDALKRKYASPFLELSSGSVINKLYPQNKELIQYGPVTYVIVSDRSFESALQPFVEWKTMKGFNVIEAYTDDANVGNTVSSIKSYLQNLYENPPVGQNPPSFVLVVGDIDKVPATQHSEVSNDPYSDLDLVEYTGDYLPEVNYGRWSADDATTVEHIVYKTIRYEKLEMDPSYLENTFLVAGNDEGYEDTYGGGAMWYGNEYYFNSSHNINNHLWLQNTIESWSGGNDAAHDSIINQINNGVAFANYTAHCSSDGWADPSFSQNDLNNYITNVDKYGVWVGNCCQSNMFNVDEAFAELAIRKENAGVIGYIGGSQYTYWDEDYWWGVGLADISANPTYDESSEGCFDGLFHDGTNEIDDISTWYNTTYQFNKAGLLAVEASSSSRKPYYWVIYQLAGDPSILPFVGVPEPMTVTASPSSLMLGMTSLSVSSAPYTYVALSQSGTLIAAAMSDASGNVTLNFDSDAISVGDADLVVTAQNKVPYIGTISVSPADEPYIVLNSYTTSADANYGEAITLNVSLENVAESGSGYDAENVNTTLSTSDTYVTISDDNEAYGTIVAGATSLKDNAYAITIANDVPDQHVVSFNIAITADGGYSWDATLNLTVNAPSLSISDLTIVNDDNADGTLDPGETGDIVFSVTNTGHADASFDGTLSEAADANDYLTLNATNITGTAIAVGASADFSYSASADAATPLGSPVSVKLDVADTGTGNYTASSTQEFNIGIVPIYPISDGGTLTVCTGTFYDSGLDASNYGDDENYTMTFLHPADQDFVVVDFTSFETESGYDFLYVYDGPDVSSALIGTYDGTSSPGTLMGANGLTFKFTSDVSTNRSGWVAEVSCYTPTEPPECVTNPIPANNATNVFPVKISWDASMGALSYDVYFGTNVDPYSNTAVNVTTTEYNVSVEPNTDYYWAVLPKNDIGTATGCDVFTFRTGAAQYPMTNTTVTTCDGVFYDTGGANEQYSSSEDITMTFLPGEANKVISANFTSFETESGYDYLYVYDGPDVSSTLIGTYDGTSSPGTLMGANGLTFKFTSDGSVTKDGWEAVISCVDPSSVNTVSSNDVNIYPNPTKGIITISTSNYDNSRIDIFTINGKKVFSTNNVSNKTNVDLSSFVKGIYFIKVTSDNNVSNFKVIVQ